MRTSLTLVVTLVVPTLMSCVSDSAELDGPPLDGGERPRIPDATSPEPFGDLRDPDALPPSVELDDEPLIFARGARFRDVQASWANAMISSLSERGVIAGYSDGTFRPNHLVTRAELAALLVAAFPRCATTRPVRAFRDVPESHWAHAAVDRAQRCAMMSGYPDGSFGPARSTTRVEALVAIHGALRGTTPSVDERAGIVERWSAGARASAVHERYFDAARIPAWAHAALISATEAGMVILGADREGIERGARRVLLHDVAATRADVAALLYGAVNHPRGDDLGENPRPPASGEPTSVGSTPTLAARAPTSEPSRNPSPASTDARVGGAEAPDAPSEATEREARALEDAAREDSDEPGSSADAEEAVPERLHDRRAAERLYQRAQRYAEQGDRARAYELATRASELAWTSRRLARFARSLAVPPSEGREAPIHAVEGAPRSDVDVRAARADERDGSRGADEARDAVGRDEGAAATDGRPRAPAATDAAAGAANDAANDEGGA